MFFNFFQKKGDTVTIVNIAVNKVITPVSITGMKSVVSYIAMWNI